MGRELSKEHKENIRLSHIGKKASEKTKQKLRRIHKKLVKEGKVKTLFKKGFKMPKEWIEKRRSFLGENNPNFKYDKSNPPLCKCGCGQPTNFNYSLKGFCDYLTGHNSKVNNPMQSRRHTAETKQLMRKKHHGGGRPKKKISIYCEQCGIQMLLVPCLAKQRKFCSIGCYHLYYTGDRNPSKRPEIRELISSKLKGRIIPEEWREKVRKKAIERLKDKTKNPMYGKGYKLKGEKNGRWVGGISFEPYGLDFNKTIKEEIRKRDNYCCVVCNKSQEELSRKLGVHHIDYNKQNNLPQNFVSLCWSCHSKTNINRNQWKTFFQSLLSERYGYKYSEGKIVIDLNQNNIN